MAVENAGVSVADIIRGLALFAVAVGGGFALGKASLSAADIISALTLFTVVVGGGFALYRYFEELRWKRKEFVFKLFDELDADLLNRQAMAMLDWESRYINLAHSTGDDLMSKATLINDKTLCSALLPRKKGIRFTAAETRIRDIFDSLFTDLSKIETFIEARLITFEDVQPHMRYRAKLIAGEVRGSSQKWEAVHSFLHEFTYTDVIKLIGRFGYTIKANDKAANPVA